MAELEGAPKLRLEPFDYPRGAPHLVAPNQDVGNGNCAIGPLHRCGSEHLRTVHEADFICETHASECLGCVIDHDEHGLPQRGYSFIGMPPLNRSPQLIPCAMAEKHRCEARCTFRIEQRLTEGILRDTAQRLSESGHERIRSTEGRCVRLQHVDELGNSFGLPHDSLRAIARNNLLLMHQEVALPYAEKAFQAIKDLLRLGAHRDDYGGTELLESGDGSVHALHAELVGRTDVVDDDANLLPFAKVGRNAPGSFGEPDARKVHVEPRERDRLENVKGKVSHDGGGQLRLPHPGVGADRDDVPRSYPTRCRSLEEGALQTSAACALQEGALDAFHTGMHPLLHLASPCGERSQNARPSRP